MDAPHARTFVKLAQSFYSLVQYLPDPRRAEAVNVGVVVCSVPSRSTAVAFTKNFAHLKRSFNLDDAQLAEAKRRIAAFEAHARSAEFQFDDEAAFRSFAASRANAVRLMAPRFVSCENPHALAQEFLRTLVEHPKSRTPAERARLPQVLATALEELMARGLVTKPGKIIIPGTKRAFVVPYAFRNGVQNYIRPETFSSDAIEDHKLEKLGFRGQLIHKRPIDSVRGKLVVVAANQIADQSLQQVIEGDLAEFGVRFVPMESAEEFAQEIERVARKSS